VGIAVHELLAFDFRNWKEERGLVYQNTSQACCNMMVQHTKQQ